MADTDILLSVDLDVTNADKTAEQLQKEIENIFNSRKGQSSAQLTQLEIQMKQAYDKANALREEMQQVANTPVATEKYSELADTLARDEQRYYSLIEQMGKFEESGGDIQSEKYQQWVKEFEVLSDATKYLSDQMEQMRKNGTAFIQGTETEKYKQLQSDLDKTNDKLKQQIIRYQEIERKGSNSVNKTTSAMNKLHTSTEKVRKSSGQISTNLGKGFTNATRNIKGLIVKFGALFLGVRGLYSIIMKIRSAIMQGFKNLRESGVGRLKTQMNDLTNACTTLKNALAGAFEPIVTAIIPYIQRLVEWLTVAIDKLAQFIAAMKGQTTYIKAIKQVGDAGAKASKQLAAFDELNVLNSQKNGAAGMFEEAKVADEMIDRVAQLKQKIQEVKQWLDTFIFNPIKDFLAWMISPITDNIEKIKLALYNLYYKIIKPIMDWIREKVHHAFSVFKEVYDEYIKPSLDKIRDKVSQFIGILLDFWNEHVDDFAWIAEQVRAIWDESIQPVLDSAMELFGALFALIVDIVTSGDLENFRAGLELVWQTLYPKFQQFLLHVRLGMKLVAAFLTTTIQNATAGVNFIRQNLDKVGAWFTAFKIKIINIFNAIRDAIREAIDKFNELSDIKIPDWFKGAMTGGINAGAITGAFKGMKNIPGMASGGVIPPTASEHLVMVGDNSHETEVVSPLSTMQEAMVNALQVAGVGNGQPINIYLGTDLIYSEIRKLEKRNVMRGV